MLEAKATVEAVTVTLFTDRLTYTVPPGRMKA